LKLKYGPRLAAKTLETSVTLGPRCDSYNTKKAPERRRTVELARRPVQAFDDQVLRSRKFFALAKECWETLMHFVALCLDRPNSVGKRLENRAAHLAFLNEKAEMVKLGGPFLDSQGQPCGSMLIVDCPDEAAARAFLAQDPYAAADLFASVELRPFRPSVGVSLA
jgi:uncharacterized protein